MRKVFSKFVTSYPKMLFISFLVVLTFSISNLSNFKLDASSDSLVLESDDDLKYYREVNSDYSSSDFLIIIFKPKEDLFSDVTISQVREMVDIFEQIEGVDSVLSYLDAPLLFSPKMSMSELADNLRTIEDEGTDKNLARLEFKNSPLYTELLTDKDVTYTAMQLLLERNDSYEAAINQRYQILDLINSEQYSPAIHDLQLQNINEEIKTLNSQASIDRDALIESTRKVIESFRKL